MITARLCFALGALALAACGARTDLVDAGAGTTSSSAGSGGAGGSASACSALALAGAVITPIQVPGYDAHAPALVPLDTDHAALLADLVHVPDLMTWQLAATAFLPWGSWPDALPPSSMSPDVTSYAVGPGAPGKLAVLARTSAGVAFDEAFDPLFALGGMVVIGDNIPRFVASHADRHLAGVTGDQGFIGLDFQGSTMIGAIHPGECAIGLLADATWLENDFLVATAYDPLDTQCPGAGAPGFTTRAQLAFAAGGAPTWTQDGNFATALRLTPRSDGAWLFLQRYGDSYHPLEARRVGADGNPSDEVLDVLSPAENVFGVAPWNDGFAIAWLEPDLMGGNALDVAVFDGTGAKVASGSLTLDPSANYRPSLAVLANPTVGSVVVAWSRQPFGQQAQASIDLARFSCTEGI